MLVAATCTAVGIGLIPGEAKTGDVQAKRPRLSKGAPVRLESEPLPASPVNTQWKTGAKVRLAAVEKQIGQLRKARRAVSAVPPDRMTDELGTLLRTLNRRIESLEWTRNVLRSNLTVLENYDKARGEVTETREQLGALNEALKSLQRLSDEAKRDSAGITAALDGQVDKLVKRLGPLEAMAGAAKDAVGKTAGQPLPDLPTDTPDLVDLVDLALAEADRTNRPPGPRPGGGPGGPSDRPPVQAEQPPGRPTTTGAPPNPGKGPAQRSDPPKKASPPAPDTAPDAPTPPQASPAPPAPEEPTRASRNQTGFSSVIERARAQESSGSAVYSSTGASDSSTSSSETGSDGGGNSGTVTDPSDSNYGTTM